MIVSTHNLTAMFTADQLKVTGTKKAKSIEKLSSGYRINRAADDAAGLSISETMRKKFAVLNRASKTRLTEYRGFRSVTEHLKKLMLWIQMSDEVGDGLNIDRPMMNATALKLSQASVASVRSAGHTLDMLSYALERVSDVRATFGAEQNRMEHTINNTQNAVENLSAAESRIRDADMATEIVRLSVSQILEQAGFSMLAQQNQSRQSVLNLLQ